MRCPKCDKISVPASGSTASKILIVGSSPLDSELLVGRTMMGAVGGVLRNEFYRMRVDFAPIRKIHLCPHEETKKQDCWQKDRVIQEIATKDYILVMGALATNFLIGKSPDDICGLEVSSRYISESKLVMGCVSHGSAYSSGWGELRFAIENFVKEIKHRGGL